MAGLTLNTNIPSLNTRRNLLIQNKRQAKSLERLSSGLRINRAADDAAGLTIAENLRAQVVGLSRAVANSQDAISLIQTAEGALGEAHNVLQRMRQLSIQSANGTLTSRDRKAIQDEVGQLIDEMNRIAMTTSFNSINLLNGNVGALVSSDDPNSITGIIVGNVGVGGTFSVAVNVVDLGKLQVQNSQTFATVNEAGEPHDATMNTQLQSIGRFQDFGVFTGGQDSVTLTMSSDVDNKITQVQVFATDTLGAFMRKISLAVNDPSTTTDLGLASGISNGAKLVSIASVGLAPAGGSVGATSLLIATPEPGRKLVFGGDSALLTALGFNEIQTAVQPVFSLTVKDIGEGKIANKTQRVYGSRASNMIQGVDIKFRTTLDISLSSTQVDQVGAYNISKVVSNASAGAGWFRDTGFAAPAVFPDRSEPRQLHQYPNRRHDLQVTRNRGYQRERPIPGPGSDQADRPGNRCSFSAAFHSWCDSKPPGEHDCQPERSPGEPERLGEPDPRPRLLERNDRVHRIADPHLLGDQFPGPGQCFEQQYPHSDKINRQALRPDPGFARVGPGLIGSGG